MPLATTQKFVEGRKIKDLSTIQQDAELSTQDLESLSNSAIDFIFGQACVEPDNRRLLSIPSRERKGLPAFVEEAHGRIVGVVDEPYALG